MYIICLSLPIKLEQTLCGILMKLNCLLDLEEIYTKLGKQIIRSNYDVSFFSIIKTFVQCESGVDSKRLQRPPCLMNYEMSARCRANKERET